MKIQNFDALATTDARRALLTIAEAGYEAIDTEAVLAKAIRLDGNTLSLAGQDIDLSTIGKIVFIAIGKCAVEAGTFAERVLGDRIAAGVLVDVKVGPALTHIKTFCGTHPLPSDENMHAAEAIVAALAGLYRARSRYFYHLRRRLDAFILAGESRKQGRSADHEGTH